MPGVSNVSVMVSTRIPKDLAKRLEAVSKACRWSKGEIHRQALEFFLPVLESGHCLTRWTHEGQAVPGLGVPVPAAEVEDSELLSLMERVEPGAKRGALVTFRDLRKAAKWLPAAFDARVSNAAARGVICLHEHDHPSGLSEHQRRDLVGVDGRWFIGAAIRQGAAQ